MTNKLRQLQKTRMQFLLDNKEKLNKIQIPTLMSLIQNFNQFGELTFKESTGLNVMYHNTVWRLG